MEGIVHVRVDDRLIHGQVATRWSSELKINRIMVIDDAVAANDMEKNMLRIAAPQNVNTSILSIDKAAKNIKNGNYNSQKVLLIVKSPIVLVELLKKGLNIKQVNIGNMSNREGTQQIKKSISVNDSEVQAIEYLQKKGVKVIAQMVPDDPDTDINEYLKKYKI